MSTGSTTSPALLLAGLALLVSTGHLTYALTSPSGSARSEPVVATASPLPSQAPIVSDCRCDDRALQGELAELRETLALLRAQANRPSREPESVTAAAAACAAPSR